MANSREYLLVWDSTMALPNGDMLNEDRPRQDELTGQLEVSDVRIKRFVRDEWINNGFNVLVQRVEDDKGKVLTCQGRVKEISDKNKLKDDQEVREFLLKNYINVRLFGAVVTKPTIDILGPLQVAWSKSVHQAEIKFMQGNAAYAGKEGKGQASIWSKYITPYGLFKTYAVFNKLAAERQGIEVSEADLEKFVTALLDGLRNYRSTSKNQMPRLLVEVIYKDNKLDGEMDYIDFQTPIADLELRNIKDVKLDLTPLGKYYELNEKHIEGVKIYRHPTAIVENIHSDFSLEQA